jgi:serine/threonine-protein kinase Stk1
MIEPALMPDPLAISEDEVVDLTYFAFANPAEPSREVPATCIRIGDLPQVLGGRYCIERLLGAGGMGVVYRARDLLYEQFGDPEPYVALKLLSEDFADSPDASALLYSEFALTRRLHHPNVLRLHNFEVDTQCQRAFFTMELMHGLTLDKLLCEHPLGLPWPDLRDIAHALLDALAYSHSRGVLHGDLKPSNVMIGEDGLRLFDFGLGQAEKGVLPGLAQLSRSRFKAWTPGYAAPELLNGAPLTTRADVFAAACVIYELASGTNPMRGLFSTLSSNEHLSLDLQMPTNMPKHCWQALRTALAFDPATRHLTASHLRDILGGSSSWWSQWFYRRSESHASSMTW